MEYFTLFMKRQLSYNKC